MLIETNGNHSGRKIWRYTTYKNTIEIETCILVCLLPSFFLFLYYLWLYLLLQSISGIQYIEWLLNKHSHQALKSFLDFGNSNWQNNLTQRSWSWSLRPLKTWLQNLNSYLVLKLKVKSRLCVCALVRGTWHHLLPTEHRPLQTRWKSTEKNSIYVKLPKVFKLWKLIEKICFHGLF